MKRSKIFKVLISSLFFILSFNAFAKDALSEDDLYEYNNIVAKLSNVSEPFIENDFIIFTAKPGPRHIGIAFDFENYKKIHTYQIRNTTDIEGKVKKSILFYILKKPENVDSISYRLIIDGLWTTDPTNSKKILDPTSGIRFSLINTDSAKKEYTCNTNKDGVKFIYKGESGQKIRLAGSFSNWDSWIYELKETKPGFYEITIPLPDGTYYYNYYIGMNPITDKSNPNKAYTQDGKAISVITVSSES